MKPNFREIRRVLGKTLTELARQIGINKSTLSRIENGKAKCPADKLRTFCEAYHIDENGVSVTGQHEKINVIDMIRILATSDLQELTIDELLFLVRTERDLGKPLHLALIHELLICRRRT